MVKECDEEASLPESFVAKRLKNVGAATYFYITANGYLQPGAFPSPCLADSAEIE